MKLPVMLILFFSDLCVCVGGNRFIFFYWLAKIGGFAINLLIQVVSFFPCRYDLP